MIPGNGVRQGNQQAVEISNDAINSGDIILFGIGLHPFEDSFSHSGYGPRLGHVFAGHSPDYPYNDVDKALRMAERIYELMRRWQKDVNNERCARSFSSIRGKLKRLFELPGDLDTRSSRWRWAIEDEFGVSHSSYPNSGGGEHPWSQPLGEAVDEIRK